METPTYTNSSVFEGNTNHDHVATASRTANPAGRSRIPTWNRRKEILYGTEAKVNPARAVARRMSLVARLLGPATSYYYWLLERIGTKTSTRFYLADAASQLGLSDRTINRFNRTLKKIGFLTITHRKHKGQNTYAEYILNPINDLIGDNGHAPQNRATRVTPGAGDKSDAAKRVKGAKTEAPTVLPSSSPPQPLRVAEQAEAGRAGTSPATATAGFATKGSDDDRNQPTKHIQSWLRENEQTILALGFKPQNTTTLVEDILRYTDGDDDKWVEFVTEIYPVLVEKARASEWLNTNLAGGGPR